MMKYIKEMFDNIKSYQLLQVQSVLSLITIIYYVVCIYYEKNSVSRLINLAAILTLMILFTISTTSAVILRNQFVLEKQISARRRL